MPEDGDSGVTMSEQQELITKVVAVATANRWSFTVDFTPHGETEVRITMPAEPLPDVRF